MRQEILLIVCKGRTEDSIKYSEADLPKNLCPLIRSSYGFAVSDTCPYFYFSILLSETTCDGKKKCMNLWENLRMFILCNFLKTIR